MKFSEKFLEKNYIPSEKDFLEYYFKETAKKTGFPINYFEDPLIRKYRKGKYLLKNPDCPKSINTQYFFLIFQSEIFVKDFFKYIDNHFFLDCILDIPDKFTLMFDKYLDKDGNKLKKYFQKNSRCKLPWSFYDIKLAIQSIKNLYQDFIYKREDQLS